MKRAAITGASGFVGGALAEELRREGYEITALVRPSSERAHLEALGARLVMGSLADADALAEFVRNSDVVYHVAAVVRTADPEEFTRSNVQGTRALLEACARRPGGSPPVVLVSSLAAAGPSPDGHLLDESEPPHPVTPYGRSKLAQEALAAEFRGRVPVVAVRPPVVYGPRDKAVLVMFKTVMMGICPHLIGGTEKSCMIHVDDLALALRLAGEHGKTGATYFATDGAVHGTLEISRTIARVLGRRTLTLPAPIALARILAKINQAVTPRGMTPVLNEEKVRDLSQRFWVCSDDRARRELGYRSRYDLESGMKHTADWYRSAGWIH